MLSSKEIELSDGQVSLPSVLSGSQHMNLHLQGHRYETTKMERVRNGAPQSLGITWGYGGLFRAIEMRLRKGVIFWLSQESPGRTLYSLRSFALFLSLGP